MILASFPLMVGYAVTARVRTADPPMEGAQLLYRRTTGGITFSQPAPGIVVVEDTDAHPGLGAFVGELHASILHALGCVGAVTNGAVRDLPGVRRRDFLDVRRKCFRFAFLRAFTSLIIRKWAA